MEIVYFTIGQFTAYLLRGRTQGILSFSTSVSFELFRFSCFRYRFSHDKNLRRKLYKDISIFGYLNRGRSFRL